MKAVVLLSGGLDSTLAIRILQDQKVVLVALNFVSVFCTCTPKSSHCSVAHSAARQAGIDCTTISTSGEFLEIVKNPEHGYGSQLNPCLDCRILMFRKASEYMRSINASFLVTGEVLGERPMSQRRDAMMLIEKEAGVQGLVVRPLSAGLLPPSLPEENGWIDRNQLLAISGRSRKPQIKLAQQYGINDYPCPAGGCLLTDPQFALKMKDLIRYSPDFVLSDVNLLKVGRHFRLTPTTKVIVGRMESENERLQALSRDEDLLMEAVDVPGALSVLRGPPEPEQLNLCAAITARYGKGRDLPKEKVAVTGKNGIKSMEMEVTPAEDQSIVKYLITGAQENQEPPESSFRDKE